MACEAVTARSQVPLGGQEADLALLFCQRLQFDANGGLHARAQARRGLRTDSHKRLPHHRVFDVPEQPRKSRKTSTKLA